MLAKFIAWYVGCSMESAIAQATSSSGAWTFMILFYGVLGLVAFGTISILLTMGLGVVILSLKKQNALLKKDERF